MPNREEGRPFYQRLDSGSRIYKKGTIESTLKNTFPVFCHSDHILLQLIFGPEWQKRQESLQNTSFWDLDQCNVPARLGDKDYLAIVHPLLSA